MDLTEHDIDEFIEMWKEAFGETLSRDQAREEAMRVLELYALLAEDPSLGQRPDHPMPPLR